MLTPEELKFFTDNKDRILDLIRAVDKHEGIRAIIGPGNVAGHPEFIPDYTRSHEVMSRLSSYLYFQGGLGIANTGPLSDHNDLPDRFTLEHMTPIVGSC